MPELAVPLPPVIRLANMVMGPVHALTRTALSVFVTSSWHWLMVVGAVLSSTRIPNTPPVRTHWVIDRVSPEPLASQYTG